MKEKYMIALDVGGTKTDAVLFSSLGEVICRKRTAGGIPFDCGVEATVENCILAVNSLIEVFLNRPELVTLMIYFVSFVIG